MIRPPTWEGDRNDLGIEASRRYPDRFGVMARIPLQRPEEAKKWILGFKDEPGVNGVRLKFSFENEVNRPKDGAWAGTGRLPRSMTSRPCCSFPTPSRN